jgi:putative mycofactocin binding protein MftB
MQRQAVYSLHRGVQVRDEAFGLLFYDYRGPRLYFVPTGDCIEARFFGGEQSAGDLAEALHRSYGWPVQWVENWLGKLLDQLEQKGLIHGQSLC